MANVDYNVLDLFAGLGGFSAAFADSDRWDVTTVEINGEFDPDIEADIFDLRPSDFDQDFDVILASPPCTSFSKATHINTNTNHFDPAGEPQTEQSSDHVALAIHTFGLIRGLSPSYWFIENPVGHLRDFYPRPTGTVTYCQYGMNYQKRTDLWGEHPPMTYRNCSAGDNCHARARLDSDSSDRPMPNDAAEKAKVPYDLSEAIRDACEAGLDGDAIEQQTLSSVQ